MAISSAQVPTTNAAKYITQLCKHWSHKLDVELSEGKGIVRFPDAVATMEATGDTLLVSIESDDDENVERLKSVVAAHLDRFAFREVPLSFNWS